MNTLSEQFHQCRRIPTRIVPEVPLASSSRSKDVPSGQDEDMQFESPPPSPNFPGERTREGRNIIGQKLSKSSNIKKYQDSSFEGDDTESELAAIRESDLSDSTIQGSSARVSIFSSIYQLT